MEFKEVDALNNLKFRMETIIEDAYLRGYDAGYDKGHFAGISTRQKWAEQAKRGKKHRDEIEKMLENNNAEYDIKEDFDEETRTVRYTVELKKDPKYKNCKNCNYSEIYNDKLLGCKLCEPGIDYCEKWKPVEFNVGDEVIDEKGINTVVVYAFNHRLSLLYPNGVTNWIDEECVNRTGKCYPQIIEVLKHIQGDNNE